MSTPQDRIQADVKAALKARDKERVSTLRMLLAELKNEKIRRGDAVDDDAFLAVVRRGIKQRQDSVEQFRRGDREELAAKEEREIGILEAYMPQQADEGQVREAIRAFVEAEGLSGPKGLGPVMKAMLAHFGGRADGKTINRLAREILAL